VGKHEGKRPVGRLENNNKMDLRGIGCDYLEWIKLA
jgi:hypothetical protein